MRLVRIALYLLCAAGLVAPHPASAFVSFADSSVSWIGPPGVPDSDLVVDVRIRSDGQPVFGLGAAIHFDPSVLAFRDGRAVPSYLHDTCLPTLGCFDGLANLEGGLLSATAPDRVQIASSASVNGRTGSGLQDIGLFGDTVGAGDVHAQVILTVIAPGLVSITVGTDPAVGNGVILAGGILEQAESFTYTLVPEPGTALLLGFGLGALGAGRRRGGRARSACLRDARSAWPRRGPGRSDRLRRAEALMRPTLCLLATVCALLGPAGAGRAAVSFVDSTLTTSDGDSWIEPGETFTIDVRMRSDGTPLHGIGAAVFGYDPSVVRFVSGEAVEAYFHELCLPSVGCFEGLDNLASGALEERNGRVQIANSVSLAARSGSGAIDPGIGGEDGLHARLTFLLVGLGFTRIEVGTDPSVGNVLVYAGGATEEATNATFFITIVPEPGTALLLGLGLVALAAARRGC